MTTCLAITPARDEEHFLPGLIASMVEQHRRADRWIILDDGSADATGTIAEQAARNHDWIRVEHLAPHGARDPGGEAVVARLMRMGHWADYDFVFRLDADLSFGADLIELLLAEFARDPRLWIAGPTLLEPDRYGWHPVVQPGFHTRGAAKLYARQCLLAIGPPEGGLGWDTLDEVRAMMLGFRTRNFDHIRARHHRPQGAAGGRWRARMAAGMAAYRIGYAPAYLLARAARKSLERGGPVAALALLSGFFKGYLKRLPRPASPDLVAFVRRQQLRRLFFRESLWQ